MTTATERASASDVLPKGPRSGSLLRAEALRFRSRRMVRALIALGVVGFLAGMVVIATAYAAPSAAGLADASHRRDQIIAESERSRADCLTSTGATDAQSEDRCGPPIRADDMGPVQQFLAKQPFALAGEGTGGVLGVSVATAALSFLIGATFVGAEWSSRSMVALLFWAPRRPAVLLAKLTVVAAATGALAVVALTGWLVAAKIFSVTRGAGAVPKGIWGQLIGSAGRGVLLVVLVAMLGFGIANLIRNTAAALGVGFVYFVIVENFVRAVRPGWQPWLYVDNVIALVNRGGLRVYFDDGRLNARGEYQPREMLLSNLHGGLVLAVVSAVVVTVGAVVFVRRDLD